MLLAMLAKEPSHGYDPRARLIAVCPLGEDMNDGQIYVTLSRLEKAGLAVAERAPGEPERKVYSLTPAGQLRVAGWLAEVSWPKPDPVSMIDAQRRELLRRLRDAQEAAMAAPDGAGALLLLEGIVLRLQADLRWPEACEAAWAKPRKNGRRS